MPIQGAIILNSPNNPTGITYSSEKYSILLRLLKSEKFNSKIYIISDELYRYLEYENTEQLFINSILIEEL